MIWCSTWSLAPAAFSFGTNTVMRLRVAAGCVGREHQMVGETRLDERHHHGNLLRIVVSALSIETDERAASANRFMHIHVRVHKIPQVSDDDAIRFYAGVLQDIELFERRLAGNSGVREDRKVRRHVRLADGAEHLAFIRGDLVPRADFAEHAERVVVRLLDERLDDLFFAHGRDLFRIKRLRVKPAACNDRDAGLHRDLTNEVDVASHVRMSGVDNAGDARALGLGDFLRHQIDVVHDVRRWGAPPPRCRHHRRARGAGGKPFAARSGGCRRSKFRVEIRRQLHVLVEKRGAARQLLGRVVFEDCSDDRAFRKYRVLPECQRWHRSRCHPHSQCFQNLAARRVLGEKF